MPPTETRTLVVAPTASARRVRAADGAVLEVPDAWELLPPGDAGLTRRVKAAGPTWTVIELKGRKKFSRGVWAPPEHVAAARAALEVERARPEYARRREADARRRSEAQSAYVEDFEARVRRFLSFGPGFRELEARLARAVTEHATPVGSGTVARTERIPIEQRAEAAVLAWMRHQTTGYDDMRIERVKGRRREVRRELAETSRALLELHRRGPAHAAAACPLCAAVVPDSRAPDHAAAPGARRAP